MHQMFDADQRQETIDHLKVALQNAKGTDAHVHMVMSQSETRRLISTLDYPFPPQDVILQPAEQQTQREEDLYELAQRRASSIFPVELMPADLLYLVERNEFLRDTLANVSGQISELNRRVDALYGHEVNKAAEAGQAGEAQGDGTTNGEPEPEDVSDEVLRALFSSATGVPADEIDIGEGVKFADPVVVVKALQSATLLRAMFGDLASVSLEVQDDGILVDYEI